MGDAFDAPFQNAWGAPFPASDQTDPTWPDTPTAESEDWRAQGDGRVLMAAEADPFLAFAESWVDERGLADEELPDGGALGEALLEMARAYAAQELTPSSAIAARTYFSWLCQAWDTSPAKMTAEDYRRATSALDAPEAPSGVEKRVRKLARRIAKQAAEERDAVFAGIPLKIDRPAGFVQEGTGPDGSAWRRVYLYDYGYLPKTEGGDGEGVDVYVGPEAVSPTAYWVAQLRHDGGFDEWKVFLGFPSASRAKLAFVLHTPAHLLGPVFEMPVTAMASLLGVHPMETTAKAGEGADVGAKFHEAVEALTGGHAGTASSHGGKNPAAGGKTKEPKAKPHVAAPSAGAAAAGGGGEKPAKPKKEKPKGGGGGPGRDEHGRFTSKGAELLKAMRMCRAQKRGSVLVEAPMADQQTRKGTDRRTEKVRKAIDISFNDIRQMVEAAIGEALPPDPLGGECSSKYVYCSDIFDDYAVFDREGTTWKVGYGIANGVVTLTGPAVPVVRQYVEVNGTPGDGAGTEGGAMAAGAAAAQAKGGNVRKDDQPGAAPAGDTGVGDTPPGGDGSDIVLVAFERLEDVVDTINANGGVLTPEIRSAVDGVCALLETVVETDDGDADDVIAAEPGAPAPMSASAKAAVEKAKAAQKDDKAKRKRANKNAAGFLRKLAGQIRAVKAMEEGEEKKKSAALVHKAITYGNEAFGTETGFSDAMAGETVPEFTDPDQLKPQEVPVPPEPTPGSQYAEDPNYTPNANTDAAYAAGTVGTDQVMSKLAGVRKRLSLIKGGAPPAAGAPVAKAHTSWGPQYLATLPDSAFLHVELANKDFAGRSNALQGPGFAFRHYAVRDMTGALSKAQIQKALSDIPMAGLRDDVKKALMDQATALLKEAEGLEASALAKSARNDDGWPQDLNTPEFRNAQPPKPPKFGYDDLPGAVTRAQSRAKAK